jgi:tRNA(Ile)-lysidine synthase
LAGDALSRAVARLAACEEPLGVAFSGGPDSLLLLELALRHSGQRVVALHVDHGFGAASERAAAFCSRQAERLGVELRIAEVVVVDCGRGLEAAARKARRQALERLWPSPALLLFGTQRDDVIEGAWLRLLAGSAAQFWTVPTECDGRLLRPLIDMRRDEVRRRCPGGLNDPMNDDPRFDRVALRRSGILEQVDPKGAAADALARIGGRLAALAGCERAVPLHDMPPALRRWAVRRELARLQPDWRPRSRFVDQIASAAAPSEKTRCFRMAGGALYLRSGYLVLKG